MREVTCDNGEKGGAENGFLHQGCGGVPTNRRKTLKLNLSQNLYHRAVQYEFVGKAKQITPKNENSFQ